MHNDSSHKVSEPPRAANRDSKAKIKVLQEMLDPSETNDDDNLSHFLHISLRMTMSNIPSIWLKRHVKSPNSSVANGMYHMAKHPPRFRLPSTDLVKNLP
jgi:hypothetical protein